MLLNNFLGECNMYLVGGGIYDEGDVNKTPIPMNTTQDFGPASSYIKITKVGCNGCANLTAVTC